MNKIIIQDEISITQEYINKCIKKYENMPDRFSIGISCWCGDKHGVIEQIKKLTNVGKAILLMDYKFDQWKESDEYKQMEKKYKK